VVKREMSNHRRVVWLLEANAYHSSRKAKRRGRNPSIAQRLHRSDQDVLLLAYGTETVNWLTAASWLGRISKSDDWKPHSLKSMAMVKTDRSNGHFRERPVSDVC
jgi:hypothetical protein